MTKLDATPSRTADFPASRLTTAAHQEAIANWQRNVEALAKTQPHLVPGKPAETIEWVYARDGALSARIGDAWWAGCSVPLETARAMLRTLRVGGTACFLCPSHAADVLVALETLAANQAIVVIAPDRKWFHVALHCCDFGGAIRSNRLWFATGENWPNELTKILEDHPGLPVPAHLIRTPLLDQQSAEVLLPVVQRVLAEATPRRATLLKSLQERPRRSASSSVKRLCVVAPAQFRLWDDAGAVLADVLGRRRQSSDTIDCRTIDPDDPCSSGPLAITLAARYCDALVVADKTREHLGPFVPPMVSVISWITVTAIPRFDPSAARDALLLADPQWVPLARSAGWPEHRLAVAQWPVVTFDSPITPPTTLAIVADTVDASTAVPPLDLSSHRLLWELMHRELLDDPFAITGEVNAYLTDRMNRLGVQEQGLDRARFIEQLIAPTYQQGLARLFLREKLPLRLHGRGWQQLAEFAAHASGAIRSRDELVEAAGDAVLVHAWPWASGHPVDSLAQQRLLRRGTTRGAYLNTARRLLSGMTPPAVPNDALTIQKILTLL